MEMRALRGTNAHAVIAKLNPIIRGWSAYYRIGVSNASSPPWITHMWKLAHKWANHHPNKPWRWVMDRYFGAFNLSRRDPWGLR